MATNLTFDIYGQDHSASKTLQKVGKDVEATGKKVSGLSRLGGGFKSMGSNISSGLGAIVGGSVVAGILSTTKDFTGLVATVKGLQKVTGENVTDASHLAAQMKLSGVAADTGQTAMKKLAVAMTTASRTTKGTADMSKLLGMSFTDAHGKVKPMVDLIPQLSDRFKAMKDGPAKVALAIKLFGKNGTEMLPFLNKGSKGLEEMSKKGDEFGLTLTGSMVDSVAKAKANTREYDAAMDGLKVTIGSKVQPAMTAIAEFIEGHLVPIFTRITAVVQSHMGAVKLAVVVIGTLVAAFKLVTLATKAMTLVMEANPIGLVVVAIAALAAGFIYLWKNSTGFREFWENTWNGIKTVTGKVIDWLKTAFNSVVAFFKKWGPLILAVLAPFIGIPLLIVKNWGKIKGFFEKLWAEVINGISTAWRKIGSFFSGLWSNITTWIGGLWSKMLALGTKIVAYVVSGIRSAWSSIGRFFTGLWSNISGWIAGVWAGLTRTGSSIVGHIVSGITGGWHLIGAFFTGLWTSISRWAAGSVAAVGALGSRIVSNIVKGLSTWWHNISRFFTGLWGNIVSWVGGLFGNVAGIGSGIVAALGRGLASGWGSIVAWFQGIWKTISDTVNNVINAKNRILGGGTVAGTAVKAPGAVYTPTLNAAVSKLHMFAKGGTVTPGWNSFGEQGPEMGFTNAAGKTTVFSNPRTRGGLKMPGGTNVVINVQGIIGGTPTQVANQIVDLLKNERRKGTLAAGAI